MATRHDGEVIERLARIEEKVDGMVSAVTGHIQEDHRIFHGEGEAKGLLIEHAQLMNSYKMWRWVLGTVATSAAAVVADIILRGKF